MTYTTVQGDRWDMIAYKIWGNESHMSELFAANKQHRDVFIFSAGVVLTVPEITAAASDVLPPWRRQI